MRRGIVCVAIFTAIAPALLLRATEPKRPASASAQFERLSKQADTAREQNKLDDAVKLYRQALKLKPAWKEGWWYLSTLLYDQDQYPDARDAFRKFTALDPKVGPGFALLGLCEFQTKDYPQALAHLNQGRRLGIESEQMKTVVLYHVALLLIHFEQFEAAGQILLGFALRGEVTPAIVEAAGLAGLRKPLLPPEIAAEDHELIKQAGSALAAAGARKVAEAGEQFSQLAARYPATPNVHYLYGSFLLPSDPEAALREFHREIELNPKHVPSLVTVSMEYLKEGDAAKGLPYAERAVQAEPQSFAAHAALGKVLAESGPVERAIQELEAAERLAPDSPQVRIALASAYAKVGRKEDAARERAEFLRLKALSESTGEK